MEFKWAARTVQPSVANWESNTEPPSWTRGGKGDAHRIPCALLRLLRVPGGHEERPRMAPVSPSLVPIPHQGQRTCALWSFPGLVGGSVGTSEALTAYLQGTRQGNHRG